MIVCTENPMSCRRNSSNASGKLTRLNSPSTAVTRQNRPGSPRGYQPSRRGDPGVRAGSRSAATSTTLATAGTTAIQSSGLICWFSSW
jgi:hypothetical protein